MPRVARVLIVDDQTLFRSGLAKLLAEDPRVEIVGQGVDGLDALKQVAVLKPDVVMMDIKMPNLDGIEMTRQLRAQSRFKQLPIIIVTGYGQGREREAWQAGASDVLIKPVSPASLVTRIRDLLS